MTLEEAERMGSYVLDAGLDAAIIPIERGDVYCVRIHQPQYYCWTWDDWSAFCATQKTQRKTERNKQRKRALDEAIQRAIDTGEPCVVHAALPV